MSTQRGAGSNPRAVIWVADDPEWERYTRWCVHYCDRMDYVLVAVVEQKMGGRYDDVENMIFRDETAELIVVPDRSHLPAGRLPRIESVTEERLHVAEAPAEERPQFLRR